MTDILLNKSVRIDEPIALTRLAHTSTFVRQPINFGTRIYIGLQGGPKNVPTCFCQNFVKSPPNLRIFDTRTAKTIELFEDTNFSFYLIYVKHYRVKRRNSGAKCLWTTRYASRPTFSLPVQLVHRRPSAQVPSRSPAINEL